MSFFDKLMDKFKGAAAPSTANALPSAPLAVGTSNMTPLQMAAQRGNVDIVKTLLDAGADLRSLPAKQKEAEELMQKIKLEDEARQAGAQSAVTGGDMTLTTSISPMKRIRFAPKPAAACAA